MEPKRVWRRGRWFWPFALIVALANLVGGVLLLIDGESWWRVTISFLSAAVFGLMAFQHRHRRTVADGRGIQAFESLRLRPDVDLRWDEIAEVRRNTAAAWADHVVLEGTNGREWRLPMVPATDVEFLTELWQAHRGTDVD